MNKRQRLKPNSSLKKRHPAVKPAANEPAGKSSLIDNPIFLPTIVLLLTILIFLPVFSSDFMYTWDDKDYITDNMMIRTITFQSVKEMFTSQIGGTYVPLPLLSYAIEYKLFGLSSSGFHFTNLLIHLCCTLSIFIILRGLGLKPLFAAFGMLIFGIHPMGVESVAWATERKDLLYTLFYLATIIVYLSYLKNEKRPLICIGICLVLFVMALLSKIQAVSLPLVLLTLDFYFRRPIKPGLIIEKIPFFLLSLVFGIAGIFILKQIGALKVNEIFTLKERIFFGAYTFNTYLVKFIAPFGLSALYPYPIRTGETLPILYYTSPVLIAILGFGLYKSYPKGRPLIFGFLFFAMSVVFLLQIFGAGQGFMADRYTKIPYVGLIFICCWFIQDYLDKRRNHTPIVFTALTVILALFMILSNQRTKVWENGETLWTDVIAKYPSKDSRPYACRGLYYKSKDQPEKAIADFTKDLEIDPNDVDILQYRGNIYFNKGKDDSAYADYIRAVRIRQDNALTYANLGAIYVRRNQHDSALINLSKALSKDSTLYTSYANRAVVYGAIGYPDESIADFKRYLRSKPKDERVIFSIGITYFNKGEFRESIDWFNKAIEIKPDLANYHWFRSQAFKQTGNKENALRDAVRARDLGIAVPPDYIKSLQ